MNKYIYGFDIGCASVGWSVVDTTSNKIVELGSNIFSEANPENNATRRQRRGQRRLLRRRKNRIRDFKVKFWNKYVEPKFDIKYKYSEIIDFLDKKYDKPVVNIVQAKVKGQNNKLENDELFFVLLNYCKHKGISYLEDEVTKDENDEDSNKLSDYAKGLLLNKKQLENMLPSQIQLERLKKYSRYRGENNVVSDENEKITLSNVFTMGGYIKEIRQLLETQKQYYSFINDDFIKDFIDLFKRKREYYVGPGNEKSRTDYGVYTTKIDDDGNYITDDNIFSKLVGKCTIYNKYNGYKEDEYRASASSYSAELYNLLNDLNNIRINGEGFTKEEREKIIKKIKETDKLGDKNIEKIFKEVTNKKDGTISGARVDKEGNNIYHKLECYRELKKFLLKENINIDDIPISKYNKIMDILTINTERDAIYKGLKESKGLRKKEEDKIELNLNENLIELLCTFRNKKSKLFSKWHSFSYKVLEQLIPLMIESGKEQMQCLYDLGVVRRNEERLSDRAILSKKIITSEIYNPVVVRATRVSIDILNALIKKYGYPQKIVIEMPRDNNDKEEKNRIQKEQKKNEKEIENIISIINKDYGIRIELGDKYFKAQKHLVLKLKLWEEQQHRCVYSGKLIDIEELLKNYDRFEIDHIIPLSISFDDSRQNKVLVYRTENQLKGQRTPMDYINSGDSKLTIDEYQKLVKEIYGGNKDLKKKYQNLLYCEDITNAKIRKDFIKRNLNDTRYASITFLNAVQDFFLRKDADTIVKVIKGSFTHQMRTGLLLPKNRDESYAHHAIDASLICYAQMGYDTYVDLQKPYIDDETGEVINMDEYKNKTTEEVYKDALYQKKWKDIKNNITDAEKSVKYWHKVDRKANRQISDETIYGTRVIDGKTYIIKSFDIRSNDGGQKYIQLKEKNKENLNNIEKNKYLYMLLMSLYDKKTEEVLDKIVKEYSGEKNPFVAYEKDTGNKIRKYSKDGNGAIISKLKYIDSELGKHIDISHKYGLDKGSKKVVLAQLVPFRTDVYFNAKTNKYRFVGIKQNTLKYDKGSLVIDENNYCELLKEYEVLNDKQVLEDLNGSDWEFKLSFYDNDYIKYEKSGEYYEERHHSLNTKNVIETKPIYMPKYISKVDDDGKVTYKKQNLISISSTKNVQKIIVNMLGDKTYIAKEKFSLKI